MYILNRPKCAWSWDSPITTQNQATLEYVPMFAASGNLPCQSFKELELCEFELVSNLHKLEEYACPLVPIYSQWWPSSLSLHVQRKQKKNFIYAHSYQYLNMDKYSFMSS